MSLSLLTLYMLDVIHLIVTVLSDRPSFEWVWRYRSADLVSSVNLKSTFSTCFRVVVAQQWHGRDAVWGFGKRTVGGARDGDWRRWLSSSDVTFLRKSQGLVKRHSYFMQAVCTLLWIDCFGTYMVVTYPLDLSYHEKARKFLFWLYWTFNIKHLI